MKWKLHEQRRVIHKPRQDSISFRCQLHNTVRCAVIIHRAKMKIGKEKDRKIELGESNWHNQISIRGREKRIHRFINNKLINSNRRNDRMRSHSSIARSLRRRVLSFSPSLSLSLAPHRLSERKKIFRIIVRNVVYCSVRICRKPNRTAKRERENEKAENEIKLMCDCR